MKIYEETIVIDGSLENEGIEAEVKKIEGLIQAHGGTISDINRWGRRKLAYPIRRKGQGYYVVVRFEAEGSSVAELERELELDETVLRYLNIAVKQEPTEEKGR
ncbi:MAG: 30S ribosomal protein S6 [bacterium]